MIAAASWAGASTAPVAVYCQAHSVAMTRSAGGHPLGAASAQPAAGARFGNNSISVAPGGTADDPPRRDELPPPAGVPARRRAARPSAGQPTPLGPHHSPDPGL